MNEQLKSTKAELARAYAMLDKRSNGCICQFEEDGETQTRWCIVHASMRKELEFLRSKYAASQGLLANYMQSNAGLQKGIRRLRRKIARLETELWAANNQLAVEDISDLPQEAERELLDFPDVLRRTHPDDAA